MNYSTFASPVEDRYFEDYVPGGIYDCGRIQVEESEIIDFAKRFDPQPFHTDPEEAAGSAFQGLIASGWHTASLMMRLFVQNYLSAVASLSSPGVDDLRWLKPVRPGDTLLLRVTVIEARVSRSKPDRGLIRSQIEVLNQRGEIVMTMKAMNLLARRGLKA